MTEELYSDEPLSADDELDLDENVGLDELEDAVAEENFEEDEDAYEEISSDEVDRVVAVLEELIDSIESENIQYYLEEAADSIFNLVYEVADDEELESEAA